MSIRGLALFLATIALAWQVALGVSAFGTLLSSDSRDQLEPVFDEVNRPEAAEYMPIYGERFSPGLMPMLKWAAAHCRPTTLIVILNALTLAAVVATLVFLFFTYAETWPKWQVFAAMVFVSFSPIQSYVGTSFHPIAWSMALFAAATWLVRRGRLSVRAFPAFLLVAVALSLRLDACLLMPVLIERLISRVRFARVAWIVSIVAPTAGLVAMWLAGDVFIRKSWSVTRLAGFPQEFMESVGLFGCAAAFLLAVRIARRPSAVWWRVVASWGLPTLLFWAANPTPPRHLWLLAYAACFALCLEPVELFSTLPRPRAAGIAIVAIAFMFQSAFVFSFVRARSERLTQTEGAYDAFFDANHSGCYLTVRYGRGIEIQPLWIAAFSGESYEAEYFGSSAGVREQRVRCVKIGRRQLLIIPPEVVREAKDRYPELARALRRAGYSDPAAAVERFEHIELVPMNPQEMDRVVEKIRRERSSPRSDSLIPAANLAAATS